MFTFRVQDDDKLFAPRGVLSVVNSLFDPLGFVTSATIQGRYLLQQLSSEVGEWDSPLPDDKQAEWRESLQHLQELQILRYYSSFSPSSSKNCVFADASVKAISAIAYLKTTNQNNQSDIRFVFDKSKLVPVRKTTIPHLEH